MQRREAVGQRPNVDEARRRWAEDKLHQVASRSLITEPFAGGGQGVQYLLCYFVVGRVGNLLTWGVVEQAPERPGSPMRLVAAALAFVACQVHHSRLR